MARTPKVSDSEQAAFLNAIQGAKPLSHDKITLKSKNHSPSPQASSRFEWAETTDNTLFIADAPNDYQIGADDFLSYKQVAISAEILRKLRKGQYNVEAVLDLHGLVVAEAKQAVSQFLQECLAAKLKVVIIIHGKGKLSTIPTLKNKLDQWLRHLDCVLAFCSAMPKHGSKGAVYVLLKQT